MIDTQKVTGGNPEAIYFLTAWGKYLRACDDIVDEAKWDSESLLTAFALGEATYASNFYRKHAAHLQMAILVGASLWSIANEWEREPILWKKRHADVLRDTDVLLLNAVCQICVGWKQAGECSRALMASAHANHIHRYGEPK